MLSFVMVTVVGMMIGMVVGLLPVLPIYLGPFLIYFFMNMFPVEHLLMFWIAVLTGSQFFGSISTITLKLPGEASSLVYLKDIQRMTLRERNALLHTTAFGSVVAAIIATISMYCIVLFANTSTMMFFTTVNFQIAAYTFAVLSFAVLNKNVWATLAMILVGIMLGPKNNYVLPELWYKMQMFFEGTTMFMVVLGLLIIPHVVLYGKNEVYDDEKFHVNKSRVLSWLFLCKNTTIGFISGLIPGPSAELASAAAYRMQRGRKELKVAAAETANNSAVVSLLVPFFALGLPITASTIIFSNIMDIKMVHIPDLITSSSSVYGGMSVLDVISLAMVIVAAVYYALATHFIDAYANVVRVLHHRMKVIMLAIVVVMVGIDALVSEVLIQYYILLLGGFVVVGILFERYKLNPLPFMFALLLGDKLVWTYIQFFTINFGS